MRIGIDIDNVISNFDDALFKEFWMHDKELRNTGVVNPNLYMTRGMFDWTEEELDDFYQNNIERIAQNLDVIDKAKEVIQKLKEDGHTINIITSRDNGDYKHPYEMTYEWLNKNDIVFDELLIVESPLEKVVVAQANHIDIMIDDSIKVGFSFKDAKIPFVLMDTKFNRLEHCFVRAYDWMDFYDYVWSFNQKPGHVIIDSDVCNECDDSFALAYLLANYDKVLIDAITIAPFLHTNSHLSILDGQNLSYQETFKIAKYFKFDTSHIYLGSLGFISDGYERENDAVRRIIDVVLKNDKTTILAIGPLTNVALAIKKEPKIINKMEVIWLGGNSLLQTDNWETNFKKDVEAVKIVFYSKVSLTIIPCGNVASNLSTSIYELESFLKDKNELCNHLLKRFANDGFQGKEERRVLWDISVIAYFLHPRWFVTKKISCPHILDDTAYKLTEGEHEITLVVDLNVNKIYDELFRKLGDSNK